MDRNDLGFSSWVFYLQNARFSKWRDPETRTGDTMIFSHIQKPLGMRKPRMGKRNYVQRVPLGTSWYRSYCCASVDTAFVAQSVQIRLIPELGREGLKANISASSPTSRVAQGEPSARTCANACEP